MRPRTNTRTPEDVGGVVSRIGTDTVSYNKRWQIHIGLDLEPARIYACPYLYTPLVYRPYGHIGKIQIPLTSIPGLAKWHPRHFDAVSSKPAIQAAHAAAATDLYRQALAALPLWRKREALNNYMRRRYRAGGKLTDAQMEKMKATGRPAEFANMSMADVDFWFAYMLDPTNF
jgi:hypothetical protein